MKDSGLSISSRFGFLLLTLVLTAPTLAVGSRLTLVQNGQPRASILIAKDASHALHAAAKQLSDYIEKSTGATLAIVHDPDDAARNALIVLGNHARVPTDAADDLDQDGFEFRFPDARTVVIASPSELGVEFGVYAFLEHYVGVRWLFPGELGEHVPQRSDLAIPREPVRDEPAYIHRNLGGPGMWTPQANRGNEHGQWVLRLRSHKRIEFHHNLYKLFPPSYRDTHPHFYPIVDGQRYLRSDDGRDYRRDWQPRFTADGIVDEAAANIIGFFNENPQATSYSLGVNDGRVYDQSTDLAAGGDHTNTIGFPDYSNVYYNWCNQVVQRVLNHHPDKLFGLLAYNNVYDPPTEVQVHKAVAPFLAYDRLKWADSKLREQDQQRTKDWAAHAETMGWYDYIYGGFFLVPRVYFHLMADYLRFGHENNVRAYYAEAYPGDDWHEGPKFYLTLRLLWDPYQDVDALLDEWYVTAVGESSAPYLREYFEFWETFWTERMAQKGGPRGGGWVRFGRMWMPLSATDYLKWVTAAEWEQVETLLKQVVAHAETDKQRQRAAFFLESHSGRMEVVNAHLQYYEGLALGEQNGQWQQAADMIRQAQALIQQDTLRPATRRDQQLVQVQVDLANALEQSGQYAQALEAYRKVEHMPRTRAVWIERAADGIKRCEAALSGDQ